MNDPHLMFLAIAVAVILMNLGIDRLYDAAVRRSFRRYRRLARVGAGGRARAGSSR